MLKIENTKVEGWEPAIRGMRNPLNSWEKSDSGFATDSDCWKYKTITGDEIEYEGIRGWDDVHEHFIGPNDRKLMETLRDAGKDHAKYRRMITVWVDLTGPLYWWKEFDTYKVGTVANSCSTMHKIAAKEFMLDDFSHEHLVGMMDNPDDHPEFFSITKDGLRELLPIYTDKEYEKLEYEGLEPGTPLYPKDVLKLTIKSLNLCRKRYLETKDKRYWWQMIQLLPSSYNQKRTVMLNYEVLANIYQARRNHKLDEWHTFCDWIESLPESWIITGVEKDG